MGPGNRVGGGGQGGCERRSFIIIIIIIIISSPEALGSQGELIVYQWSGVRRPSVVVVHNAQTSSSRKPLGRSKPNFMWSLHGKGERKFI